MKTITMNKAGIPDILACSSTGRFWAIEVKTLRGKASRLQLHWIAKLQANGAVAFIAYGWDDFLVQFNNRAIFEANS